MKTLERDKLPRSLRLTLVVVVVLISLGATQLFPDPKGVPRAEADATSFIMNSTVYGPNDTIAISVGALTRACDLIETASDIYIVRRGTAATLADVSGSPNTITSFSFGSLIINQTIGFTVPSGGIPPGEYDVVEDACQNGVFDAGDSVLSPGFSVVVPGNIPALPGVCAQVKADAAQQAAVHALALMGYEALGWVGNVHIVGDLFCFVGNVPACVSLFLTISGIPITVFVDAAVEKSLENAVKHYQALAADPPDADFQRRVELGVVPTVVSPDASTRLRASAEFANASALSSGVTLALIQALERYQGATEGGDLAWALRHARAIKVYAQLLADSLPRQSTAALAVKMAVDASSSDLDMLSSNLVALQNRIKASGFTPDEIAVFKKLCLTNLKISDVLNSWNTVNLTFTRAGFGVTMQQMASDNATLGADLQGLATAIDPVIATLESQITLTDPEARPGGPYAGIARTPVSFNGSVSTDGGAPPLAFAWDLDGNGDFNDGIAATAAFTYPVAFHGLVALRVTNDGGLTSTVYAPLEITDSNRRPEIDGFLPTATSFYIDAGTSVTFEVGASDPDGDPVTVNWLLDTTAVAVGPSFIFTPTVVDAGQRVLRAQVSDDKGAIVEQRWTVNVFLPPGPPTAFFNPSPTGGGRNVALLGGGVSLVAVSSFFPGHTPEAMLDFSADFPLWATANGQTTGQFVTILLAEGKTYLIDRVKVMPRRDCCFDQRVRDFAVDVSTTTVDDSAFTTVLTATAADNGNLQEFLLPKPTLAKYVRYRPINNRGSACCISTMQFKVLTGQEGGQIVSFQNLSTDPDNDIAAVLWDFGDGTTSSDESPTHAFPVGPAQFTVSLTLTDSGGRTNTFTLAQRILVPPVPSFTISPLVPSEGEGVTFTDTSTSQGIATIVQQTWDFGDGPGTAGSVVNHTFFDSSRAFIVTLEVLDSLGQTATIQQTLTPQNLPPGVDTGPTTRTALRGSTLSFNTSVVDPGLDPVTCHWDFGDGASSSDCNFFHKYNETGTFSAVLSVMDAEGGITQRTVTITVSPGTPVLDSYNALSEFSGVQGGTSGVWFYQRYDGTTYQNLSFDGSIWTQIEGQSQPYRAYIFKEDGNTEGLPFHPGLAFSCAGCGLPRTDVVLKWIAPHAGTYDAVGFVRGDNRFGTGGNGFAFSILSPTNVLYSLDIASDDKATHSISLSNISLNAGDFLAFQVYDKGDNFFDPGIFDFTITSASLDHFLCYRSASSKGDLCTSDSPSNSGGVCEIEEDCGGTSDDDDTDETSFCVPNKFPKGLRASLVDQLEPSTRIYDVKKPVNLCAPAEKNGEGVGDVNTHLQSYQIVLTKGRCGDDAPANAGGGCTKESHCGGDQNTTFCVIQPRSVKQLNLSVTNQFHPPTPLTIDAIKPDRLLVPTAKNRVAPPGQPGPSNVDHYKCYKAKVTKGSPKFEPIVGVVIEDQFSPSVPRVFDLKKPTRVCVAADKNGEGIKHSSAHLMCYKAVPSKKVCAAGAASHAGGACTREPDCGGVQGSTGFCVPQPKFQKVPGIFVDNQFGPSEVDTTKEDEFCVPSMLPASPA